MGHMKRSCSSIWAARVLIVAAAFLASLLAQPASAYYFENYVKWANQAVNGGPTGPNCTLAAVDFLDFVYAIVEQAAPTVGTAQLTQACLTCSAALGASLAFLPGSKPAACPLLPDAATANLTGLALRRFVCFGAQSGGGDAGTCVVQVVDALKSVGLLERVRTLDPSLTFSGSLLPAACAALFPAPTTTQPASCCARSWAYLMAGLAQQSCMPGLSHEYASLPGRCEALQNRTAPGFCEPSWPTDLLPLLAPPPAAGVCGSAPPGWINGSACSTAQLLLTQPPSSTCDLWCGIVGEMGRIATGEIPGPEDVGNNNSSTNGATPPADRGDGSSGGGGNGKKLQTPTIVIVCVFSVLIVVLLIALAVFGYSLYKEKQAIKREAYQFDTELQHAEMDGPEQGPEKKSMPPPPPGAPGAGVAAPSAPSDSAPATPRGTPPLPSDAAAAAAAGGILRTPKYAPGPPPATPTSATATAMAAAASASQPIRTSNPTVTARALVFGDAARGAGAGGAAAVAVAAAAAAAGGDTASRSPRSSKYESATSLFVDPAKSTSGGLGLLRYSTPAAAGSTGNLVVTGATPSSATSVTATAAAAGTATTVAVTAVAAVTMDRLRSHRLSLTDSETAASVYQTAHSPESGFFAANAPGPDASGSYGTVRSAYTANTVSSVTIGSGGGAGSVTAAGRETYKRTQSASTAAALTTPS